MANKNITDLPVGAANTGYMFEQFNTAAGQNQQVSLTQLLALGGAGAAGTQTFGMSNLGNTSGTTGVATGTGLQFFLAGGNNVTLSQSVNGASGTITISAFNQSVQPEGTISFGMSNLGNTSGTTGVATGTGPALFLAGGNNMTLSQSLNGASATITFSAFNASVQPEGTQTFGMSNIGNTSGTTGVATGTGVQMVLAGGNNVTLSQSLNGASATITISAGAGGAAGTNTLGMSNIGNTSGDTAPIAASAMRLVFAGGNNITLSQSTNGSSATITISAGSGATGSNTLGMSNVGNTSGTTGVISGTGLQFVLAGGNNVTLSQSINGSSATITISAAAAAGPTLSFFNNMDMASAATAQATESFSFQSMGVFPLVPSGQVFPGNMTINTFNMLFSISGSTATMSSAWTTSIFVGLYTFNASTLSLLNSVSTSFGTNAGNANLSTQIAGLRWLTIHSSAWSAQPVLTAGHYWIGTFARSSGQSCQTGGFWGEKKWANNLVMSGSVGVNQVNNTSVGFQPYWGQYATTTAALPTAIASNDINKQVVVGQMIPCIHLNNLIASF